MYLVCFYTIFFNSKCTIKKIIHKIFRCVTSKLPYLVCNMKIINTIRAPFYIRPRVTKFLNPVLIKRVHEIIFFILRIYGQLLLFSSTTSPYFFICSTYVLLLLLITSIAYFILPTSSPSFLVRYFFYTCYS